jgi:hypothetical protein
MFGWSRLAMTLASSTNIATNSGLQASAGSMRFSAKSVGRFEGPRG